MKDMDNANNNIILSRLSAGDEKAFEKLFKSYYPRLYGYAIRYINDPEVARDILQECFMRFWEQRNQLKNISLTSYLFTMVRNSCLNHLKHLSIVDNHKLKYLSKVEGDERLYYWDFGLSSDQQLIYDELQNEIEKALDKLPARCREVFIMSRFKDKKNREIAEELGISTTAVEKHISKALIAFKTYFSEQYPTEIFGAMLLGIIGILK